MCGDPPNIIIGTSLGYSFTDFFLNTGLMAGISLILIVIYFYCVFGRQMAKQGAQDIDFSKIPEPKEAITNKKDFIISCIIFTVYHFTQK